MSSSPRIRPLPETQPVSRSTRPRPPFLRALGPLDPPAEITIQQRTYQRVEIFKHDSWAATARYVGQNSGGEPHEIVCKLNRAFPIGFLPMSWLGRLLAQRERLAFHQLAGVRGIPQAYPQVMHAGQSLRNAVAHDFVPGRPLKLNDEMPAEFFESLLQLLDELHARKMAYVDLHKRENILIGEDGQPHLFDFQVCFGLWSRVSAWNPIMRQILSSLQKADLYHFSKHVVRNCPSLAAETCELQDSQRPWWISAHRSVAAPLRTLRRKFLALIRVRGASGRVDTEAFAEHALRAEILPFPTVNATSETILPRDRKAA